MEPHAFTGVVPFTRFSLSGFGEVRPTQETWGDISPQQKTIGAFIFSFTAGSSAEVDKLAINKIGLKMFFSIVKKNLRYLHNSMILLINVILLSFVYFIGIGFVSIAAKLFGKKFLQLKIPKDKETYWINLNLDKKPIDDYYRQF